MCAPVCQPNQRLRWHKRTKHYHHHPLAVATTQCRWPPGSKRRACLWTRLLTWCSRSSQPAPRLRPRDVCCCCWEVRQCYSVHSGVDSVRKSTAKYFATYSARTNVFCLLWVFSREIKSSELIFENWKRRFVSFCSNKSTKMAGKIAIVVLVMSALFTSGKKDYPHHQFLQVFFQLPVKKNLNLNCRNFDVATPSYLCFVF